MNTTATKNQTKLTGKSAVEDTAAVDRSRNTGDRENDANSTSEERFRAVVDEWDQEALPTPPEDAIPGFHLCWLSTTNSSDPIYKRIRMGYTLVMADEIPDFKTLGVKEGEYAGCVSCNEMLLAKIPEGLYQRMMQHYHHDMPLEEESMLRETLTTGEEDRDGEKLGKVEGEGFQKLGTPKPVPRF